MIDEKRYTEEELIDPALYIINQKENSKITTTELIKELEKLLKPNKEDMKQLFGRNDTKFSQKVRNLISHKSIYPEYVDYNPNGSTLMINENGKKRLFESNFYKNMSDKKKIPEKDEIPEFEGDESLDSTEKFNFLTTNYINCQINNYSVYELKRRYDKASIKNELQQGILILNETFQRDSVWSKKQKSQLIESIIIGIPIPFIYLYESKYNNLVVIDGRQRLTALFEFLNNKFALSDLELLWKELNGKKVEDLIGNLEAYKAKIEDAHLSIIKIGIDTPETLKLKIFSRVNQNGTKLNSQELRHALHQGNSTKMLEELSNESDFLSSKNRMKDRYLILRYISLRLFYLNELKIYSEKEKHPKNIEYNDIDTFLGEAMDSINSFTQEQINDIKKDFIDTLSIAKKIFKEDAFKLSKGNPINMILFEVTLLIISMTIKNNINENEIKNIFNDLKKYNDFDIENGEPPFFRNIKYHRDSKENFFERITWIKELICKYGNK